MTPLEEFTKIRYVLCVPFPEDLRIMEDSQFPDNRKWKKTKEKLCLFYLDEGGQYVAPMEKVKTKKES